MTTKELKEQVRHLESEVERLTGYIAACRAKFGDAAVNTAIMEVSPRVRPSVPQAEYQDLLEMLRTADRIKRLRFVDAFNRPVAKP